MKNQKLVSGILSIVLFVFVAFQSWAAGVANTLRETGEIGGSRGIVLSILMLTGRFVSISTRKGGNGGNIAWIILFGLGSLLGFTTARKFLQSVYLVSMVCTECRHSCFCPH